MTEINKYCTTYEDWIRTLQYKNTKDGTYDSMLAKCKDLESQRRWSALKLTREQVAELEAHIPTCPRCSEALEQMNRSQICRDFQLAVWDLALNPDEVEDKMLLATYEKHLENCLICEGTYHEVKGVAEELKQIKLPEPPSDLEAKIKNQLKTKVEVKGSQRHPHRMARFIKYATAASVLAVFFGLLMIFVPKKVLPEAVAEAGKLHEMYLKGETNTLKEFASYNDLDNYCKGILSMPSGTIPKVCDKCSAVCICGCIDVCDCVDCEASGFTNKGAWLTFERNGKPISLMLVKSYIKLSDWAKVNMDGMDCYVFTTENAMVCAYNKNGVTYFWVSQLGKSEMREIVTKAMKD